MSHSDNCMCHVCRSDEVAEERVAKSLSGRLYALALNLHNYDGTRNAMETVREAATEIDRLTALQARVEAEAKRYREALLQFRGMVDDAKENLIEIYCDVSPEDCDHCVYLAMIDDALDNRPAGTEGESVGREGE